MPRPNDPEYTCFGSGNSQVDIGQVCVCLPYFTFVFFVSHTNFHPQDASENPYHRILLDGHDHAVRALAARGRTLVSGSYDCTVRIWDLITGECKFMLVGHTQKVYSVVLNMSRNQACSGSMDGTVRVWSVLTGECVFVLMGHTSLVGLLGLSPSYLVSAAADSTLRIWNLDSGELVHTLAAHTGAITCFVHDEFKVLSGSDGNLKMWDIREGGVVRDLLGGVQGVWQVVCEGRWCVAASNRGDGTVLDVWDFSKVDGDEEEEGEGEGEEGWVGEVVGGVYDDDVFAEEEEEDVNEGLVLIGKSTGKGKRKMEDDAMDLDGAEDEEMCSPVPSRGGSVSASASQGSREEGSRKPGLFRFYGQHRHRRRGAVTEGEQTLGLGGEIDGEGEGEMQDMRVVEGLVGGGWDERLNANASSAADNNNAGRSTVSVSSRRLVAAGTSASSLGLVQGQDDEETGLGVPPTGAIRSFPPTSGGVDDTPTRPRGGAGAGLVGGPGGRSYAGRRK